MFLKNNFSCNFISSMSARQRHPLSTAQNAAPRRLSGARSCSLHLRVAVGRLAWRDREGEYLALIPCAPQGEQREDKVAAPPQFCVTSGQEKSDVNNPFPPAGHSNFPASLKPNSFS